jgi:hypothetical protein
MALTKKNIYQPFLVPVFTLEYVEKGLHFLSEIAAMISTMGLKEKHIMEANRALKGSLKEKEVLLREVHHRVNNNIQIVSSISALQENYLGEEKTLNVLKENINRIKAIAIVHTNLYESPRYELHQKVGNESFLFPQY